MRRFPPKSSAIFLTMPIVLTAVMLSAVILNSATGGEAKWQKQPDQKRHVQQKRPAKQFILEKELVVKPGGTLNVEADRGSIEVQPGDVGQVTVEVVRSISEEYAHEAEAILKYHEIAISKDGNNTFVQSRVKPASLDSINVDQIGFDAADDIRRAVKNAVHQRLKNIHFRVVIPRQYNVKLKTGGQRISCGDLDGNVQCSTTGGGIKLGKITGRVHATTSGGSLKLDAANDSVEMRTSGGSIHAGDIQGNAVAMTSGGSIRLGRVRGRVTTKTSGGSIRIANAEGAVEAVTSGGSVNAAISQQPKADSYFATSGGSVNISLAKHLALDIEHLGQGKVTGPIFAGNGKGGKQRTAKLNGGGPKLTAKGKVRFAFLNAK